MVCHWDANDKRLQQELIHHVCTARVHLPEIPEAF